MMTQKKDILTTFVTKFTYLGMKLFQMKQYAKVLECFDLIKSLPPSCYTNYHHYKGDCLIQMGKIDEGIKAFDEMLSGNQMTKFFYLQKKGILLFSFSINTSYVLKIPRSTSML
ncbi:hypothetical protein FGO68_gene16261 [Halteria grandinella]|uniref:Tetratricopeptide repeat protein n=1 Tax=Halteria grandinella TaxID=5974 RepID=A0A8J8NI56_HALGN|nr:hypothetical protein FGO68_gene16261 [Halteria grandinella]